MNARDAARIFWDVRRFLEVRNPELLPTFTPLFEEKIQAMAEFANEHFPHPEGISWTDTNPLEFGANLRKFYPKGVEKK